MWVNRYPVFETLTLRYGFCESFVMCQDVGCLNLNLSKFISLL